jgi:hypothetical protein
MKAVVMNRYFIAWAPLERATKPIRRRILPYRLTIPLAWRQIRGPAKENRPLGLGVTGGPRDTPTVGGDRVSDEPRSARKIDRPGS